MAAPDLHIISFAVPYPAQYGGAIDVWNRIKALSALGLKIHLHCFIYAGYRPNERLREVAETVHYYPRVGWSSLLSRSQPYIVSSRKSGELLKTLLNDKAPVLFEGMHTTGFVPQLTGRKLLLRAHNVEYKYYHELADQCRGFKSLIYRRESQCLEDYEKRTAPWFDKVFSISPLDHEWFAAHQANSVFVPPFHGFHEADIKTGRGQYLLYQGDLSLEINQNALLDLVKLIPAEYPLVAAGRSGDKSFEEKLSGIANLRREADVSHMQMKELIRDAQLILVHSLHDSGMKLKLFPALYFGRFVAGSVHCRTNTPLDQAMHFYTSDTFEPVVRELWPLTFTPEYMAERKQILGSVPDDTEKAKEIARYL